MPRPMVGEAPLSAAERQKRHREQRKKVLSDGEKAMRDLKRIRQAVRSAAAWGALPAEAASEYDDDFTVKLCKYLDSAKNEACKALGA